VGEHQATGIVKKSERFSDDPKNRGVEPGQAFSRAPVLGGFA
jgi:hypothetical protein